MVTYCPMCGKCPCICGVFSNDPKAPSQPSESVRQDLHTKTAQTMSDFAELTLAMTALCDTITSWEKITRGRLRFDPTLHEDRCGEVVRIQMQMARFMCNLSALSAAIGFSYDSK